MPRHEESLCLSICFPRSSQEPIKGREALAWADELGHPFMKVFARFFAAMLHYYLGDVAMTRKLAEETVALWRELGMACWQAAGATLSGGR
jgi:hypothetical protein